ncbi:MULTISPECIES: hypothetical protein [unclassified Pseudomonas]|uniref:hypothetical protein n=1 Tax=unclassified Pseudomonas TaxID=196821 RepID=UPI002449479C|nr:MULTISPECIES: hypothetical protein [unclassified Pseudomonas]MDH0897675.1 hypothetical protein [Pseudomonas sp. GD03875]MDH1067815.1 hypothetical protein [Pseudomonas sp. GD03985]
MKNKILAIIALISINTATAATTEIKYSYTSTTGFKEIATWTIKDGNIISESICDNEIKNSIRYYNCLDGARDIMVYICLIESKDYGCDGYREISRMEDYLVHRREVNSAPFSEEAKKFAPDMTK